MQLGAALHVRTDQEHGNRIVTHTFSFLCANRRWPLSEEEPKRGLPLMITIVKAELRSWLRAFSHSLVPTYPRAAEASADSSRSRGTRQRPPSCLPSGWRLLSDDLG